MDAERPAIAKLTPSDVGTGICMVVPNFVAVVCVLRVVEASGVLSERDEASSDFSFDTGIVRPTLCPQVEDSLLYIEFVSAGHRHRRHVSTSRKNPAFEQVVLRLDEVTLYFFARGMRHSSLTQEGKESQGPSAPG